LLQPLFSAAKMPISRDPASVPELSHLRETFLQWQHASPSGLQSEPRDAVAYLESLLGTAVCRRLGIYRLSQDFMLSVVIPVFNEAPTIDKVIHRVRECGIRCELIVVDDASTDGTREALERYRGQDDVRLYFQETNQGKGAALKRGFAEARGDVVVVQDADLEYDPADFSRLLQPIIENQADVVYGSRFIGDSHRVLYFWHSAGNKFLTLISNLFTNLNLSDIETCYKMFRREIIQNIAPDLKEKRFGIEPELTAKVARLPGVRIYERPISYSGRTYAQGKKIGWRDGLRALWCIFKY
jgi:glycosyltransferase involved in cell wall biosynthesis